MYSGRGNTPSRVLGFPIRTSADQNLVDSSPQLFAVTHVLHRFLAPRHPPLALCSLEEQRCSCLLCSSQRASPAVEFVQCTLSCTYMVSRVPWQRSASSCRARRATHVGRLPQNGREDKVRRFEIARRTDPTTFDFSSHEPTNAPTGNWFEPDRTKCRSSIEQ